jgi:putative acetyltransferase
VIHVTGEEALDFVDVYSPHIHAFLLDSGRPGEKIPVLGGTGRTHDWTLSSRFVQTSKRPVFLAGGITADNVGDAVRQVRPFGPDLCSGVRTNGQLDAAKLASFMMAVRRTEWEPHPRLASGAPGIRQEDPAQSDVVELLRQGEAFSTSLYPPESNHHLPLEALRRPEVRFFVARDVEGKACATGALVLHDDWAEIKRMWVEDAARDKGIARQILNVLVAEAVGAGVTMLRLETGVANHAALALYEKTGFQRREPFADYRPDPLSVFMERQL